MMIIKTTLILMFLCILSIIVFGLVFSVTRQDEMERKCFERYLKEHAEEDEETGRGIK